MKVVIAKEWGEGERRPLLIPADVALLNDLPLDLSIEANLGIACGYSDNDYRAHSRQLRVVRTAEAWTESDVILKLKCPTPQELDRVRRGAIACALFHAESQPQVVDRLIARNITAYSFEYFQESDGRFPLMAATGEISGKVAAIFAAYHLQSHVGGRGVLLTGTSHVPGAKVAVLGYGNVGQAATTLLRAMGAQVIVFRWGTDVRPEAELSLASEGITTFPWTSEAAQSELPTCDVIIAAIRVSTFDTPPFVTEEIVRSMKTGSLIIDCTAGFGSGYIETSTRTTSLLEPYHVVHGVKHVKIRNLPLGVHLTAARQISKIYGPYIAAFLRALCCGVPYSVAEAALITRDGTVCNPQVARHYEVRFAD